MGSGLKSMLEVDPTFDEEFCMPFEVWCKRTGYDPATRTYRRDEEPEE